MEVFRKRGGVWAATTAGLLALPRFSCISSCQFFLRLVLVPDFGQLGLPPELLLQLPHSDFVEKPLSYPPSYVLTQ